MEAVSSAALWGRVALGAVLVACTPAFVFAPLRGDETVMSFPLHGVWLAFHEAGHLLFGLFGRTLGVAGGTLMQWLMPVAVMVSFARRLDPFGVAIGAWGLGASVLDAAPYLFDASLGEQPLLGGVFGAEHPEVHDWMVMLRWVGAQNHAQLLAKVMHVAGALVMVGAIALGAWALKQMRIDPDRVF